MRRRILALLRWAALAALPAAGTASALLAAAAVPIPPPRRWRNSILGPLAICVTLLALATFVAPYPQAAPLGRTVVDEVSNLLRWNPDGIHGWTTTFEAQPVPGQTPDGQSGPVCVDLPPRQFMVRSIDTTQSPGAFTGSVFLRAHGDDDVGKRVHVRVSDGRGQGSQTDAVLSRDWTRNAHTHVFAAPSETGSIFLRISNETAERWVGICVWGAQLEAGGTTTAFSTIETAVGGRSVTIRTRFIAATFVVLGPILAMLAVLGWRGIWSRLGGSTRGVLGLGLIAATTGGVAQRLGWLGTEMDRATGWTFHPNVFGAQVVVLGFLLLAASRSRFLRAMILTITLFGVIASGSRGVAIAFAGASIVYGLRSSRLRRFASVVLVASAIALAVAAVTVPDIVGPIANVVSGQSDPRLTVWPAAIALVLERPIFGWGLNSSADQLALVIDAKSRFGHSHNILLEVLVSFGLCGLVALASLGVGVVRYVGVRLWTVAAPLTAVLLANMVDVTLLHPAVYGPVLASLGFACSRRSAHRRHPT